MVLTGLIFKYFIDNLSNFPDNLILVRKEDVLSIESIEFKQEFSAVKLTSSSAIDLSKLEDLHIHDITGDAFSKESVKFKVEGLSSLKVLDFETKTAEVDFSIKNLPSLTHLYLNISGTIDEDIVRQFVDECPHIQQLYLEGNVSHFNLDSLVNLRKLRKIISIHY